MKTVKKKKDGALWALKRMVSDLSAIRRWLFAIFLCAFGVIACNIIEPKLLGGLIGQISDYAVSGGDSASFLSGLQKPMLLLLVTYACYGLFSWGKAFFINNAMTNKITAGKRIQLSGKIQRLPLSYLDNKTTGDIISLVHKNVGEMGGNIHETIDVVIMGGLQIVAMAVMML